MDSGAGGGTAGIDRIAYGLAPPPPANARRSSAATAAAAAPAPASVTCLLEANRWSSVASSAPWSRLSSGLACVLLPVAPSTSDGMPAAPARTRPEDPVRSASCAPSRTLRLQLLPAPAASAASAAANNASSTATRCFSTCRADAPQRRSSRSQMAHR
eukprot:365609-Chlamydomonas_euryale.AAC.2